MLVFVTGATGYIGSVVVEKLRTAGHDVSGLARSEASARKLKDLGVRAIAGDLSSANTITSAAYDADAVIHLAMEFSANAAELDRMAIDAILEGLGHSGKAFLYTSGIWVMGSTGDRVADESTPVNPTALIAWRPAHEQTVLRAAGVRGIVIRPGMVYGRGGGAAAGFLRAAKQEGVVRYIGSGENRWPFVHVDDLADLYVLALNAPAGSVYFATAGDSVKVSTVAWKAATLAGASAGAYPIEEARRTMGPLADALTLDQVISSEKARNELDWHPTRPPVLDDLRTLAAYREGAGGSSDD